MDLVFLLDLGLLMIPLFQEFLVVLEVLVYQAHPEKDIFLKLMTTFYFTPNILHSFLSFLACQEDPSFQILLLGLIHP